MELSTKPMNILEFLEYANDNPNYFIYYLECIIDERGIIHLAIPSHEKCMHRLCLERNPDEDFTMNSIEFTSYEDCGIEKYGLCNVRYGYIDCPVTLNKFQRNTIKKLYNAKLLSTSVKLTYCCSVRRINYLINGDKNAVDKLNEKINRLKQLEKKWLFNKEN